MISKSTFIDMFYHIIVETVLYLSNIVGIVQFMLDNGHPFGQLSIFFLKPFS